MSYARAMSLQLFPAEIKILILCSMPDYESMKSLAHVSSSYHQAYLKAQEDVLHHVTTNTLHEVGLDLLDPWSVLHAPRPGITVSNRLEIIDAFLETYGQGRMTDNLRLSIEDSLNILRFHVKFRFIIDSFCRLNLSRNPLYMSEGQQLGPDYQRSLLPQPSYTELRRLNRAFWRWELCSKLFVPNVNLPHNADTAQRASDADSDHIARNFLGLFPIHEVEEVASLRSFVTFHFAGKAIPFLTEAAIALGPALVYSFMVAHSEQLMKDVSSSTPFPLGQIMRDTLRSYEWIVSGGQGWPRRVIESSSRVDSVPTDGWLWASLRGAQNTDYKLRRWGYVFWDRRRLDEWGVNQQRLLNWPWPKGDTHRWG